MQKEQQQPPRFRYWRLSQLFFALLLTLLVLHSIFAIDQQTNKLANTHIINGIDSQLSLIQIPAQLLVQASKSKQKKQRAIAKAQILALRQSLQARAEITQVNFYDQYGQDIIKADENNKSLNRFLPIGENNPKPILESGHELHIQTLYGQNNELIGFAEVVINMYRFTGMLETTKRKNDQKIRVILLCGIFIGFFLTKAFSRKHRLSRLNKNI